MEQVPVRPIHRVFAKFIDLALIMGVAALYYPYGPLLGFLYSLFSDALPLKGFRGQSVGKKVFRLKVIPVTEVGTRKLAREGESQSAALEGGRRSIGWKRTIIRNAPVGVATFFALVPVWGWAILALVGFPLMIIEIYLLVRAPRGQRLGDVMADTMVVAAD